MNTLKDFAPGDIVTVTPECANEQDAVHYDFSAWGRTRMRVTGIGEVFVELIAIDSRPDRDWILRSRTGPVERSTDPNEIDMFWLPEQLQKIS